MNHRTRNERGSASVEAVIGVPAFLLLVGLLVLGGRQAIAQQAVQAAAGEAACAASIARTATAAGTDATTAARHSLANQDLDCATTTVTVDTAAFATEVGTPGEVSHRDLRPPTGRHRPARRLWHQDHHRHHVQPPGHLPGKVTAHDGSHPTSP